MEDTSVGGWIGLMTRQSIVDQLAHTAALQGWTAADMTRADDSKWYMLAADAFAVDENCVRQDVIKALPS